MLVAIRPCLLKRHRAHCGNRYDAGMASAAFSPETREFSLLWSSIAAGTRMDIISLCCTRALVYDAIFCGHEMRLVRRDCSCLLCQSDLGSSATIEYFGPFPLSETVVLPPVNVFMMCRRHALPLASWKATHILVLIDLMPTKEN
ncbi:hypothetical protein Naga_101075g2 [Nannochloropsis gaditana]|uniref:Uncharacterized protein n=1 Tax=Nannochloropsis gaditana TaxID=72520 RepID=W7TRP7_9STRA|nr:hypothetical protein Naga_101075g2 [Nannochloropsis gaditana]